MDADVEGLCVEFLSLFPDLEEEVGDGLRLSDGLRLRLPPLNEFGDIGGDCGGEFGGSSGGDDERPVMRLEITLPAPIGGETLRSPERMDATEGIEEEDGDEGDGERIDFRLSNDDEDAAAVSGDSGGDDERCGDGLRLRLRRRAELRVRCCCWGEFGGEPFGDFLTVSPKSSFVFVEFGFAALSLLLLPPLFPPLLSPSLDAFRRALCTDGDECGEGGTFAPFEPSDEMLNDMPPVFGLARMLRLNDMPPPALPLAPFAAFLLGDSGGDPVPEPVEANESALRFFLLAKVRRPRGSSSDSDSESVFGRSLKSSSLMSAVFIGSSSSSSSSCQYAFSRLSPSLLVCWSPSLPLPGPLRLFFTIWR